MILIPIKRGHLEQTGNEETWLNYNLLLQYQGSGDEHAQIMPCNKNVNPKNVQFVTDMPRSIFVLSSRVLFLIKFSTRFFIHTTYQYSFSFLTFFFQIRVFKSNNSIPLKTLFRYESLLNIYWTFEEADHYLSANGYFTWKTWAGKVSGDTYGKFIITEEGYFIPCVLLKYIFVSNETPFIVSKTSTTSVSLSCPPKSQILL